jgi:hypothetical protein
MTHYLKDGFVQGLLHYLKLKQMLAENFKGIRFA